MNDFCKIQAVKIKGMIKEISASTRFSSKKKKVYEEERE